MEGLLKKDFEEYVKKLVKDVKAKKELKSINDELVREKIFLLIKKNNKIDEKIEKSKSYKQFRKSEDYKKIIKTVRADLRNIYGMFILEGYTKKDDLLEKLKKVKNKKERIEVINKILMLHLSTKERIPYYEEIYKKIFAITKKPKVILDLGCGLNPVSYPYLYCKPTYIASDLSEKDCEFIKIFFKIMKIKGDAFSFNLLKLEKEIPKADVCFLFKTLDSLESNKRDITRELLERINTRFLVVSFSKKSLSAKKEIKTSKREWFKRILEEEGLNHSLFETPNELFYVVKKKPHTAIIKG